MADEISIRPGITIPVAEIELRASRSSGPGGQHANVTESRIEAVLDLSETPSLSEADRERLRRRFGDRVTAVAQDARSQARNRELALERLEEKVAGALKPRKRRRPTRPSRRARERRLERKRRRSNVKRDRRRPQSD